MRKIPLLIGALAAVAVLAAPTAAAAKRSAKPVDRLAAQTCAQERHQVGRAQFRKKYGQRPMRACVRRTRGKARGAFRKATDRCSQELALLGPVAFGEEYDFDEDPATDFAECVAETALEILDPEDDDDLELDDDVDDPDDPDELYLYL
jgi:hypothetical protein